jgi:hypothetical protein
MLQNDYEALDWCKEHDVQITFMNGRVKIIDPFIIERDQVPVVADTLVDAVNIILIMAEEDSW